MKILKYPLLFLFLIGSIYYINQSIMVIRKEDPIMKQIEESKRKYEIKPVNALIQEESMIPGLNGTTIDIDKTYHQMKQYGTYNESLTVLKEQTPDVSIEDYYNKYIEHGNRKKRKISLIFPVTDHLETIVNILEQNQIVGTIFLDGTLLEKEFSFMRNHKNHEYEILSYQKEYPSSYLKTSLSYLQTITNQKPSFCYNNTQNTNYLKFCIKEKLHTIQPTKNYRDQLFSQVRKQIESGDILSIEWNEETEKDFSTTIQYIKSKGYEIVTLKELLNEKK